jgi:hypothetical protein
MAELRNAYKVLNEETEEARPPDIARLRWRYSTNMDFKEMD